MAEVLNSVQFLIGVYWPFLAVAGAVGLVTGWLSLSGKQGEGSR
jgi:hypothetical protein